MPQDSASFLFTTHLALSHLFNNLYINLCALLVPRTIQREEQHLFNDAFFKFSIFLPCVPQNHSSRSIHIAESLQQKDKRTKGQKNIICLHCPLWPEPAPPTQPKNAMTNQYYTIESHSVTFRWKLQWGRANWNCFTSLWWQFFTRYDYCLSSQLFKRRVQRQRIFCTHLISRRIICLGYWGWKFRIIRWDMDTFC